MNQLVQFDPKQIIQKQSSKFLDQDVFASECEFAIQALRKNDYLMNTAKQNPQSLEDAITNVSKIGISLDPSKAHAYLVPRKIFNLPCVVLDISYRGLCRIAVDSNCIKFVKAMIFRKNDTFESMGIDKEPKHTFNPFSTEAERGEIVGVYCVVKTLHGDYLTETMTIEEVNKIKGRSEMGKKDKGPWVTDFQEMAKKTVIKRASKQWPVGDGKLHEAVEVVNQHEGIDFALENTRMINENELANLEKLASKVPEGSERVLKYITALNKGERKYNSFEDLTEIDYLKAVDQLTQTITRLEKEANRGCASEE